MWFALAPECIIVCIIYIFIFVLYVEHIIMFIIQTFQNSRVQIKSHNQYAGIQAAEGNLNKQ